MIVHELLSGEAFKNQVLKKAGEKPYQWATQNGIGRRVIDSIKKGKIPDPKNLIPLANALGFSLDKLLTGKEYLGGDSVLVREEAAEYLPKNQEEMEIIQLWREQRSPQFKQAARAVLKSGLTKKDASNGQKRS